MARITSGQKDQKSNPEIEHARVLRSPGETDPGSFSCWQVRAGLRGEGQRGRQLT